jgi:hypothetical protein
MFSVLNKIVVENYLLDTPSVKKNKHSSLVFCYIVLYYGVFSIGCITLEVNTVLVVSYIVAFYEIFPSVEMDSFGVMAYGVFFDLVFICIDFNAIVAAVYQVICDGIIVVCAQDACVPIGYPNVFYCDVGAGQVYGNTCPMTFKGVVCPIQNNVVFLYDDGCGDYGCECIDCAITDNQIGSLDCSILSNVDCRICLYLLDIEQYW